MKRNQSLQEGIMESVKHLLFVDDEDEVLKILVDYFSDTGYRLHVAKGTEEALQIIKHIPVDLVFSDLRLRDGLGSDLLKTVKATRPDAVRMLTSGYLDIRFGKIQEDQIDGTLYLSKPWDLATLKTIIAQRIG
jgi:DNA-binding NtrC family response regulator